MHSHTPSIHHFPLQHWKYNYSTPLLFNRTLGCDWRIQTLNTKDRTSGFSLLTLEYEHCWLSAFNVTGNADIKEEMRPPSGIQGEKCLFIHGGRRSNFSSSPFILQSQHKQENHLMFLATVVKKKTLARFEVGRTATQQS